MWAFLIIDVCDKMPDAITGLGDALIVIDVNFFLFERAYESFSISVLPGRPRSATEILMRCSWSVAI